MVDNSWEKLYKIKTKEACYSLPAAIQVYFVYQRIWDAGMFDLRWSESERVRSGCGRKEEPEVVEPIAAAVPQTYWTIMTLKHMLNYLPHTL
jgi:hypothetical protein